MEYKEVSTLLQQHIGNLYSDFSARVVADRVHPNMMNPQASGRVGISRPPLGNFTKDQTYGPHGLTDVIQPDPGMKWIVADWSAVELEIVMHRCQDPTHLEVRRRGLDPHTANAIRMFKYPDPPADPTKDWLKSDPGKEWRASVGFDDFVRTGVKNAAYTSNYSKKPEAAKLYATKLGMDPDELVEFVRSYQKSKPRLTNWKQERWDLAWSRKESRTAFGRRRRLFGDRYSIEKEGLNHEVQGTVADCMKMTMVELDRHGWPMALQQHDGWKSIVPMDWEDWAVYTSIVEREWVIDNRPITFGAEYDIWYPAPEEAKNCESVSAP